MADKAPVLPDEIKALLPSTNGTLCQKFTNALIALPTKWWQLLNWMFNSDGYATHAYLSSLRLVRPGTVMLSAESSPADDAEWLVCNGQEVSKTTYAALYAAIGDVWGTTPWVAPTSSANFRLPAMAGRFPLGVGGAFAIGGQGGEETHTLTTAEMPEHHHNLLVPADDAGGVLPDPQATPADNDGDIDQESWPTTDVGGGEPHNNMPPYAVFNYIIKT